MGGVTHAKFCAEFLWFREWIAVLDFGVWEMVLFLTVAAG